MSTYYYHDIYLLMAGLFDTSTYYHGFSKLVSYIFIADSDTYALKNNPWFPLSHNKNVVVHFVICNGGHDFKARGSPQKSSDEIRPAMLSNPVVHKARPGSPRLFRKCKRKPFIIFGRSLSPRGRQVQRATRRHGPLTPAVNNSQILFPTSFITCHISNSRVSKHSLFAAL